MIILEINDGVPDVMHLCINMVEPKIPLWEDPNFNPYPVMPKEDATPIITAEFLAAIWNYWKKYNAEQLARARANKIGKYVGEGSVAGVER